MQEFEDAQLELVAAQSAFKITQPAFYGIANSVKRFELDAEKTTSSDAQSLEMTRLEFEPEPIKLDFDPLKFDVPSD